MSKISNAAKAASLLHHTWGIESIDEAVRLYDVIASSDTPVVDILEKHHAGIWDAIDQMHENAWWENVEMLASSIDSTRAYFETKEKA